MINRVWTGERYWMHVTGTCVGGVQVAGGTQFPRYYWNVLIVTTPYEIQVLSGTRSSCAVEIFPRNKTNTHSDLICLPKAGE